MKPYVKKNCRKSYENTVTEGTNLRPIKAMRRDEGFGLFAQVDFAYAACF